MPSSFSTSGPPSSPDGAFLSHFSCYDVRVTNRTTPFTPRGQLRRLQPTQPQADAPPAGRRLGVVVEELEPAVAEFLGFDAGQGLSVTTIEDDSLAAALGVEEGDVLLRIGKARIAQRSDVASALGAIESGAKVTLTVNRRGREVELTANKP